MDSNENNIVMQNELIIGNSDSILLFGSDIQQQLADFSKMISSQLVYNTNDLESLIHDILDEINDFQNSIKKKPMFLFGSNEKKRQSLIKEYNHVLMHIDKMEISLKLQEAQVIKDSKLFEELGNQLDDTTVSLKNIITYGHDILIEQKSSGVSDEIAKWYERLSKKIEDLEISNTVAMQTRVQINLMLENNAQLIDKIVSAVSNTIPIWRNQITLLLGIEKMNQRLDIQNQVLEMTQKYVNNQKPDSKRKSNKNKEISTEKLLKINETLKSMLDELDVIEKRDGDIRSDLSSSLI